MSREDVSMGAIKVAACRATMDEVERKYARTAGVDGHLMLLRLGSRMAFTDVRHHDGYAAVSCAPKSDLEADRGGLQELPACICACLGCMQTQATRY